MGDGGLPVSSAALRAPGKLRTFSVRRALGALALLPLGACAPGSDACERCDTLTIAALGEPDHLLPPFVWQTVGRDIGDLVFERLARLEPGRSPLDPEAYRLGLAERWERIDSLGLRFHLRPEARWPDGTRVTASDVVFSFEAYQDSALDAPSRSSLADLRARAEDSGTVAIRFDSARPDQLYDATYHVRVFRRALWDSIPRADWGAQSGLDGLEGSGPYRVAEWRRGEWLALEARDGEAPLRRIVWRFARDPDAVANLLLSGEADLLETMAGPGRRSEFERAEHLRLVPYPSSVYGFLGFNLAGRDPWTDVRVRRALREALDRATLARAVLGEGTLVPEGPLSAQLWLWENPAAGEPDSAAAAALLDAAGWSAGPDGRRAAGGRRLTIDILVPATSAARRDLALAIQERWARLGITATLTTVDFPVFQERLAQGRFQTYIGAWLDEPHPRSLRDQWTRDGWPALNYGHYANPRFDSAFAAAVSTPDTTAARRAWRAALAILDDDAPAIWLYTPANVAVVNRRLAVTEFEPFAWLDDLAAWRMLP